jgi:hypothetical protein
LMHGSDWRRENFSCVAINDWLKPSFTRKWWYWWKISYLCYCFVERKIYVMDQNMKYFQVRTQWVLKTWDFTYTCAV